MGDLPAQAPDPVNTVLVVETEGDLEVKSNMPSLAGDQIVLRADFADIHNPGYGTHAILTGSAMEAKITNWVDPRARLEWMFHADPGTYVVKALVMTNATNRLILKTGDVELEAEVHATEGLFTEEILGEIEILETGDHILSIRPFQDEWTGIELGTVTLAKQ